MAHIVVYDRKSTGNPTVMIHSSPRGQERGDLQHGLAGADPKQYGVVLVPDEVVTQMVARKYKRDRKGKVVLRPVLQEKAKNLASVSDSSLGENILVFGEPYTEIKSITDLAGKKTRHTAVNPEKGVIGVGTRSGHFTVTCEVDTGARVPEGVSEEKNWEWERDREKNIVGMKLLKKQPPSSED